MSTHLTKLLRAKRLIVAKNCVTELFKRLPSFINNAELALFAPISKSFLGSWEPFWRELQQTRNQTTTSRLISNAAIASINKARSGSSKTISDYLLSSSKSNSRLKSKVWPSSNPSPNISAKMTGQKDHIRSSHPEGAKLQSNTGSKNFTVAVEGNIGSGKSTLLNHFEKFPFCEVIGEPINQWTNLEGHNALGLLYDDPGRWSFSFNMYAQLTRIDMHIKPHTYPVKILERSLFSTRYCFVQNDFLSKTISPYEFSVFNQWFDFLTTSGKADLDLIVYLRADPSTCYDRLRKRSRKEEAGVPMSLIESLHKLHDDWLLEEKYPVPAPILVLDANSDLETMKQVYDSRRQEILCGYS